MPKSPEARLCAKQSRIRFTTGVKMCFLSSNCRASRHLLHCQGKTPYFNSELLEVSNLILLLSPLHGDAKVVFARPGTARLSKLRLPPWAQIKDRLFAPLYCAMVPSISFCITASHVSSISVPVSALLHGTEHFLRLYNSKQFTQALEYGYRI